MKILCFHLNQVGDLIFSLPALKCLRDSYPDSTIISVVRSSAKEILESTGLVNEIVLRKSGINLDKVALVKELASKRANLAVVFSQSAECAVLAYLSGASERVGFIDTSLGFLLTKRVYFKHPPSTENNLRLISEIGCKITQKNYSNLLSPTEAQICRANKLLSSCGISESDKIVAFAPGTSGRRSVKEWTEQGYLAVERYLISQGYRVVILGAEPMDNIVEDSARILDMGGKTNLGEVVAILARSKALLAVDSGILHLAAAVGTPVVGLYGPSNPKITGPQGDGHIVVTSGVECSPCMKTVCDKQRDCMIKISEHNVIDVIERIMSR